MLDFDPNELVLSFQAAKVCAKFRQNWIKIVRESADYTERDDTGDLIIYSMLRYSNGTDNKEDNDSKPRKGHDAND